MLETDQKILNNLITLASAVELNMVAWLFCIKSKYADLELTNPPMHAPIRVPVIVDCITLVISNEIVSWSLKENLKYKICS